MASRIRATSALVPLFLATGFLMVDPAAAVALTPRIVNGLPTTAFPTTAALLESTALYPDGELHCTGTLVGSSTILTAAHCVCDPETLDGAACQPGEDGAPDPADYHGYLQNLGIVNLSAISVHPDFDPDSGFGDLALLHFAACIGDVAPNRINLLAQPAPGLVATIAGFGATGDDELETDRGIKRHGDVSLTDGCPADTLCWDFEDPVGPPGSDSNICGGDSGGPLFGDSVAGQLLAGVTSENLGCLPSDPGGGFASSVYFHREWIASAAGPDLGRFRCDFLTAVGEPGSSVEAFSGTSDTAGESETFEFEVATGTRALRVALNGSMKMESGVPDLPDFDLYIRHGEPPTPSDFDCASTFSSQFEGCLIDQPATGDWFATVVAESATGADVPFQLVVTRRRDGAGSTIFVEPAGVCLGEPRCFAKIQDAINAGWNLDFVVSTVGIYDEDVVVALGGSESISMEPGWNDTFNQRVNPVLTISSSDVAERTVIRSMTIRKGTVVVR